MQKIEIDGDLDRSWVISLLAEGYDTYQILKNYQITEELISDCADLFDKEILLQGFNFSENFIRTSLENQYFTVSDIKNLNMKSYALLSSNFIQEYSDLLNWNRILVYLSTQTNSFINYISIIEEKNLWSLISANDLPIDFIKQYKEKLDWNLLSMIKCFTEEEKQEFSDYIIETKKDIVNEELNTFSQISDLEKDYSVDEISDLIEKYMSDNNKYFYLNIEKN
jgi:hypothetical protein